MNGLLSARPWSQSVVLGAGAMVLLLSLIQPGSTAHLSFFQALQYWFLHLSVGLLCGIFAIRLIQWLNSRFSPLTLLIASGTLAAWLFVPLALGIERWFPTPPPELESGFLDQWETRGGFWTVLAEGLQIWPQFVLVWIILNLPPVLAQFASPEAPRSAANKNTEPPRDSQPAETPRASIESTASDLFERLPPAIGRTLVSASSDLHYLHVHTTAGKAMILGSLSTVESDFDELGLRIHRAHWVAADQVQSIERRGSGWVCETSDGRQLPISRRRVSAVRARLGSGFMREPRVDREKHS